MYTARIVVLTIALGAGGVAAYLARGFDDKSLPTEPVVQLQTVDVLVAKSDIGLGQSVAPDNLQWQTWPKREKNPDRAGAADAVNSEIILTNVRVLAIDQAPKERDGQNAVVGKTVTVELRPEQAETLARARQSGTLALALRSIADLNMVENASDNQAAPRRGESINVVQYGVQSATTTQK
jgi:pilus assembly protein CpaB